MRTQKEIDAEIVLLTEQRKKVRTGMFGNNRASIDAQVRTLKEKLSEDRIYDIWPGDGSDGGDDDSLTRMNALDARNWMIGESDEKPSDGWAELCG